MFHCNTVHTVIAAFSALFSVVVIVIVEELPVEAKKGESYQYVYYI